MVDCLDERCDLWVGKKGYLRNLVDRPQYLTIDQDTSEPLDQGLTLCR